MENVVQLNQQFTASSCEREKEITVWDLYGISFTTQDKDVESRIQTSKQQPRSLDNRYYRACELRKSFRLLIKRIYASEDDGDAVIRGKEDRAEFISSFFRQMAKGDNIETVSDLVEVLVPEKDKQVGVRELLISSAHMARGIRADLLFHRAAKVLTK